MNFDKISICLSKYTDSTRVDLLLWDTLCSLLCGTHFLDSESKQRNLRQRHLRSGWVTPIHRPSPARSQGLVASPSSAFPFSLPFPLPREGTSNTPACFLVQEVPHHGSVAVRGAFRHTETDFIFWGLEQPSTLPGCREHRSQTCKQCQRVFFQLLHQDFDNSFSYNDSLSL